MVRVVLVVEILAGGLEVVGSSNSGSKVCM